MLITLLVVVDNLSFLTFRILFSRLYLQRKRYYLNSDCDSLKLFYIFAAEMLDEYSMSAAGYRIRGLPFQFNLLLLLIWTVMEMMLGIKCLKTAKNPTRRETWNLVKRAIQWIAAYFVYKIIWSLIILNAGYSEISEYQNDSYESINDYQMNEMKESFTVAIIALLAYAL